MATVVSLGANRVDPRLQLGQAIEKGAARLDDVMMAQNQREWQEKMRREAEERADKRQKEQDKRLLNRQIALENNKRVYEQNQKKADAINNARLYDLVNSVSKENKYGKRVIKPVPLKVGLWALMKKETKEVPFLPVITKGDLRAFRKDFPCLHLHRIQPSKLVDRSPMEIKAIQKVIRDKLKVYM